MPNCGCLNSIQNSLRRFIDLTGKRFGKLIVKNRVFIEGEKEGFWFCECDCGNTKIVKGKYLRDGLTKSCGCLVSYLENVVEKFLQEKNISYQKQYSFIDLYDKDRGHPLRFDFAILDKKNKLVALIECQGKQHYDKSSKFFTEDGIKRDLLKEEYCKNNNIKLIKIYS